MKKTILLFTILLLLNSCSKDDSNNNENPEEQNTEVQENVVAILEENSQITSSETDLENGIYSIQFSGNPPKIYINDIIIGDQGEGFLRKVTNVSTKGNTITMQTTQANMEDVFKDAIIEFNTDLSNSAKMSISKSENYKVNYLAKGVQFSGNGFEFDFSNTILYQEGALTFEITNGTADFNPNFSFKGDYSLLGGLDFIDFKANNAELSIDVDVSLNASAGVNLPKFSTTLADVEKKLKFLVGGVPVVVIVNTTLVAELNASIDSNFDITTGFTNNYILSTSAKYENDSWTGDFHLIPSLTPKLINMGGEVNIAQNLTITPKVSVKFYGVIGPYCQPEMREDFTFNIATPSLDWDSNLKVGLNVTTGVDITIFGYDVADFSRTDSFEEIVWNAPETLEIVSGNDQTGNQGEQLAEPLKVKVTDKLNNPISNVPVYFNVTKGDGSVDNVSIMTDDNGFAKVFWILGDNTDEQTVEVNVKKANGTNIAGTPMTFNASLEDIDLTGNWIMEITNPCEFGTLDGDPALYGFTFNSSSISFNQITVISDGYQENGNEINSILTSNNFQLVGNTLTITLEAEDTYDTSCNNEDFTINYTGNFNITANYQNEQFEGTIIENASTDVENSCDIYPITNCSRSISIYRE